MFEEMKAKILSFTDPYDIENYIEEISYSDDITNGEYTELYEIALNLYRELLDRR